MNSAVIAICGPQGSGKTTLANALIEHLGSDAVKFGIKSCFDPYVESLVSHIVGDKLVYEIPARAKKEIQKSISVWAETYIDPYIWSRKFAYTANSLYRNHVVITDDIRTAMNFEALAGMSKERKIVLVSLDAPEAVRRKRLGGLFRDIHSYTEQVVVPDWWPESVIRYNTNVLSVSEMVKHIVSIMRTENDGEEHA